MATSARVLRGSGPVETTHPQAEHSTRTERPFQEALNGRSATAARGIGQLALNVALGLAVGDVAPAIVELLALGQTELNLGPALVADVHAQRHDRQPLGRGLAHQRVDLRPVEQQLAVAPRLVVVAVALLEWRDVRVHQPRLALFDTRIGVGQVGLAGTDALDLRTGQDDARLERIGDEVVVARLAVERHCL